MPFTPAHAAAVLPFFRLRRLSQTALVAGSFSPDFEYFLKMKTDGQHGHTLAGLFYFDLPVTILLAFIFQQIVKDPLVPNLPPELQIKKDQNESFVAYVKAHPIYFAASCLLGASTHIFWDGFTHVDGFFVRHLSFYDGVTIYFENVDYPLWYALQHLSTFVGLAALTAYVAMAEPVEQQQPTRQRGYWIVLIAITIVTVTLRFYFDPSALNLGNFVVTGISGLCLGLIGSGLLYRKKSA
jgi:hypothetical protein